jgi:DNA-binding transcriptional regulator YiaG
MRMTETTKLAAIRRRAADGTAKNVRLAAHLSCQDIADTIGVDTSTVWKWEAGQRTPTGAAALRYADLIDRLMLATEVKP